MGCVVLALLS